MAEWILAFLLMFGAHEAGHVEQARTVGYDLEWSGPVTDPVWYIDYSCERKPLSLVAGAGFRYEDKVSQSLTSPSIKRKAELIKAGRKLAYLIDPTGGAKGGGRAVFSAFNPHNVPGTPEKDEDEVLGLYGDMAMIEDAHGRDATRAIILITALSDSLGLTVGGCRPYFEQSVSGVPMLALGCGF